MSNLIMLLINIIPIALVAAISPTTFAVLIVLLSLSKRPKTSGAGFLAGSGIVVVLAALLGLAAAQSAVYFTQSTPGPLKGIVDLILGVLLLVYAVKIIVQKKELWEEKPDTAPGKSPRAEFAASMFLAMGMFALNFITTVLVFFAGTEIALAEVGFWGKVFSLVVLISIALALVEIPLLIYIFQPQKADKILYKLNQWIKRNGYYLTAALVFIVGGYLLYNGFTILNGL